MPRILVTLLVMISLSSCSGDDSSNKEDDSTVCDIPTGISTFNISDQSATISWLNQPETSNFEIEYGETGFIQGQGQLTTTSSNTKNISNLTPETSYQYYIRANCINNSFSEWAGPQNFTTNATPSTCAPPVPFLFTSLTPSSKKLSWSGSSEVNSYTIEHGIIGFTPGNGTIINTTETTVIIDYETSTGSRELYIKSNCEDGSESNLVGPLRFFTNGSDCGASNVSIIPLDVNSVYLNWGATWVTGNSPNSWIIEFGPSGFEFGNGIIATTTNTESGYVINNLMPLTSYDFYIKGNCNNGGTSLYTGFITYTTLEACPAPQVFDISYTKPCEMRIDWSSGFSDNWDFEYGLAGFIPGEGTSLNVTSPGYTLEDLSQNTSYDFYVRSNCDTGDSSERLGPLTGTTESIGYTGNYYYESIIDGQNGPIFGSPHIVELVEVDDHRRSINVTFYEDLNQGNLPFDFEFSLECNEDIVIPEAQDTNFDCGSTTVQIGPYFQNGSYSQNNDSTLEIRFEEYTNFTDCDDSSIPSTVRILLTKQ